VGDDDPVTYGRWAAEHAALTARVAALEARVTRRGEHQWAILLTVLAGLALPVLLTFAAAGIHRLLS